MAGKKITDLVELTAVATNDYLPVVDVSDPTDNASGSTKKISRANLVTGLLPTSATTASITDSTNKRYVTDAELTVLGNTSGTNTGDQTLSDATIATSDITTNNVSTSKHGFAPKLPGNTTTFFRGDGTYAIPSGTGGGIAKYARSTVLTVAASNAKDTANADYICTGTNDHTTINTALAALPAGGGTVVLSDGTFSLGGTITITANQQLIGQGIGSTVITTASDIELIKMGNRQSDSIMRNWMELEDMSVNNTGGTQTHANVKIDGGGRGTSIKRVATGGGAYGFELMDLDRCYFEDLQAGNPKTAGIFLEVGLENTWGTVTFTNCDAVLSNNSTYGFLVDKNAGQASPNAPDRVNFIGCMMYMSGGLTGCVGFYAKIQMTSTNFYGCLFEQNTRQFRSDTSSSTFSFLGCTFLDSTSTCTDIAYITGSSTLSFYDCRMQQATNGFNAISGFPSVGLFGRNNNQGNITNLWVGSFAAKYGTDTNFGVNGNLSLGASGSRFDFGFINKLVAANVQIYPTSDTTTAVRFQKADGTTNVMTIDSSNSRVGIGTTPTAKLHLPAGTATANTAPLKLTSGVNLTTPEDGAIEYNGTHYYATVGATRYQLDQQSTGGTGITSYARSATIVVAASNSKDTTNADYICTGTNDHTTINTAIAALPSTGGRVVLMDGTYNLGGTINITVPYTELRGQGWNTKLAVNNSTNIYAITFNPAASTRMDGCVVSDMRINANGANQTTAGGGIYALGATFSEFNNLYIDSPWNNGLYLYTDNLGGYGHHNSVHHCTFLNGQNTNGGDGRALLLENSDENIVEACIFQDNGRAAATEPNHVFDKAGLNTFIGNQFVSGQTGLKLQGSQSRAIGNTFDGCQNEQMRLNGDRNQVIGNLFYNIGYNGSANSNDGLWVDNVQYCNIQGNTFMPLTNSTNARCGVNLSSGPATNNLVTGNIFTLQGSGTATWGTGAIIPGSGAGNIIFNNTGYTPSNLIGNVTVVGSDATSSNSVLKLFKSDGTSYIANFRNNGTVAINAASDPDSFAILYVNGGARFDDDFRFKKGSGTQYVSRLGGTGFDLMFQAQSDQLGLYGLGGAAFKQNLALPVVTKSANYTATLSDYAILVTGTTTITLPDATVRTGQTHVIKNTGSGIVTVNTTSAQTIDGGSTASLPVQYTSITVTSDGANWNVI